MKKTIATALFLIAVPLGRVCGQAIGVGEINLQPGGASNFTGASTLYDTSSSGSLTSATVNWSGSCTTCSGWGASGSGAGFVNDGTFGNSATLSVTGSPPAAPAWIYGETVTSYGDTLTIGGGTGTGVLAMTYSLTGSLNSGAGYVDFGLLSAPTGSEESLNGGAYSIGSNASVLLSAGSQSEKLTIDVPFTYGSAFTIYASLVTSALYTGGTATPSTSTVDFHDTMILDSAVIYSGTPGARGVENASAAIDASTGLIYGANGISVVPLPATVWLLLSALGGLGFASRRRLTD